MPCVWVDVPFHKFDTGDPHIAGRLVRFSGANSTDPCESDVVNESHAQEDGKRARSTEKRWQTSGWKENKIDERHVPWWNSQNWWKMAVTDRVWSLLKSETSQKGKDKGKDKGKKRSKTLDTQKLYSLYQDHHGPLSEDQAEHVMLQSKKSNPPAGPEAKSCTSAEERSRAKRKARHNHKRRRARSKERALEKDKHAKSTPNLHKRRERTKATARKVSRVENRAKIEKVHVETVIQTREIHTLFRVPCGWSWNVLFVQMSPTASALKKAAYFWLPTSRSVCNLNSRQAPCVPGPSFGWMERTMPNTVSEAENFQIWSRLTQASRDTENELRWEGNSWPEWVRKAGVREHDEQAYCALQHIARSGCGTSHSIFPRPMKNVVYRSDRENDESNDWSTQEDPSAKTYLNFTRLALKQIKDLGLTAIPRVEKDSGFALMKLSDVSALHEDTLAGKRYNEFTLHDINSLSMKSLWK